MNPSKSTIIHQEPEGTVRSWHAYGNGILLRKEEELFAYRQDGTPTSLINCLRDDSAKIGRAWHYVPYIKGAIFYEFSRRLGHEGMEIDRRETITAYSDDGKRKKLYDSGDQYIYSGVEWLVYQNGIIMTENGQQSRREPEKERDFCFFQDDGTKRLFYRGKAEQWRVYGKGLLLREYHSPHHIFSSGDIESKISELARTEKAVQYWEGYGRGLLLGIEDELWTFRDDGRKEIIYRGKLEEVEHKPCREGMMIEKGDTLELCRDDGVREMVYEGRCRKWDVFDDKIIVELVVQEVNENVRQWVEVKLNGEK